MEKKLLNEIKRIHEISNYNKNVINEGLIEDIKHFFEIASPEILNTEVVQKLKKWATESIPGLGTLSSSSTLGSSPKQITAEFEQEPPKINSSDDDFYRKVLEGIGAEFNDRTKLMMYAWRRAEGAGCKYNPFNTKREKGLTTTNCNNVGVKNYLTKEDGVKATIESLTNGNFDSIVESLKNSDTDGFIYALGNSTYRWGTNPDLVKKILVQYYDGTSTRTPTPIGT